MKLITLLLTLTALLNIAACSTQNHRQPTSSNGASTVISADVLAAESAYAAKKNQIQANTPLPNDRDGDTIVDSKDICPETLGKALLGNGCGLGQKIPLLDAHFFSGSTALSSGIKQQLYALYLLMREGCDCIIEIQGHADTMESIEGSEALARARADAAVTFLSQLGVPPNKLYPEGYGSVLAIAVNDTPEGRKQNRRIELRVMR